MGSFLLIEGSILDRCLGIREPIRWKLQGGYQVVRVQEEGGGVSMSVPGWNLSSETDCTDSGASCFSSFLPEKWQENFWNHRTFSCTFSTTHYRRVL